MNLFILPQLPIPEELVTVLAQNANARVKRIVSSGHASGWHDQSEAAGFM